MTSADFPSASTSNPRRKDEKGKQVLQPGTPSNGRPLRHRSAFVGLSLSSRHYEIHVVRSYIAHADSPLLQACNFPHEVAPANRGCKSSVSKAHKGPLSYSRQTYFPRDNRQELCRAFALEGTGIWHAATVSLAQQLWGPLRGRLDSRLALDTTAQVCLLPS